MAPTATRGIRPTAHAAYPATQTRSSLGYQCRLEAPAGSGRVRGPDGQREAELQGADQMASTAAHSTQADGAAAHTAARLPQLQQKKNLWAHRVSDATADARRRRRAPMGPAEKRPQWEPRVSGVQPRQDQGQCPPRTRGAPSPDGPSAAGGSAPPGRHITQLRACQNRSSNDRELMAVPMTPFYASRPFATPCRRPRAAGGSPPSQGPARRSLRSSSPRPCLPWLPHAAPL